MQYIQFLTFGMKGQSGNGCDTFYRFHIPALYLLVGSVSEWQAHFVLVWKSNGSVDTLGTVNSSKEQTLVKN